LSDTKTFPSGRPHNAHTHHRRIGIHRPNLAEQLASTYEVLAPSSAELDLLKEQEVREYLVAHKFRRDRPCRNHALESAPGRSSRPARPQLPHVFQPRAQPRKERFGKMIHFGSGAEYDRTQLPPRVREDYFDTRVPRDAYGFSKYICAKYIERSDRMVDLRLFGVFGAYEDYTVRFISNAFAGRSKDCRLCSGRISCLTICTLKTWSS
jgi:hypothetical protein